MMRYKGEAQTENNNHEIARGGIDDIPIHYPGTTRV
jgi:hypothetical protein